MVREKFWFSRNIPYYLKNYHTQGNQDSDEGSHEHKSNFVVVGELEADDFLILISGFHDLGMFSEGGRVINYRYRCYCTN